MASPSRRDRELGTIEERGDVRSGYSAADGRRQGGSNNQETVLPAEEGLPVRQEKILKAISITRTSECSTFVAERGKIVPQRISGVCAPHQRQRRRRLRSRRRAILRCCRSRRRYRTDMEVILREDIDKLGNQGRVVKVAAKTCLLPASQAAGSGGERIEQENSGAGAPGASP